MNKSQREINPSDRQLQKTGQPQPGRWEISRERVETGFNGRDADDTNKMASIVARGGLEILTSWLMSKGGRKQRHVWSQW